MSLTSAPRNMQPSPQPRNMRPSPATVSTVVELNVGGQIFTTTVGTLRKFPGSKLAEMFSTSAKACMDGEGRFFFDRSGTYFRIILDYLRTGQVPRDYIPEVYREAQFYEIQPLVKLLEDTPQIFGEQTARKQFSLQIPSYNENLELLLRLARAEAVTMRKSQVVVHIAYAEVDAEKVAEQLNELEAQKKPVVKFGPLKKGLSKWDILDCIQKDIRAQGYEVSHSDFHFTKPSWASLSTNFHVFSFTWW